MTEQQLKQQNQVLRVKFQDTVKGSFSEAISKAANQITLFDFIPEDKISPEEAVQIIKAAEEFYLTLKPINEKYLD